MIFNVSGFIGTWWVFPEWLDSGAVSGQNHDWDCFVDGLSVRLGNALTRNGIDSFQKLLSTPYTRLRQFKNLGNTSTRELAWRLGDIGILAPNLLGSYATANRDAYNRSLEAK